MRTYAAVACLTLILCLTPILTRAAAFVGCKDQSFNRASKAQKLGFDRTRVNTMYVDDTGECMESQGYRFTCLLADSPIPGSEVMASCYDPR